MAQLSIRLLGPFQVTLEGKAVTGFETVKAQALLAYLAAEADRSHPRECLAEMLWPDRPAGAARANLRHTLAGLRRVVGDRRADPPFLLRTRQTIQFNTASDVWVDTHVFVKLLERNALHVPPPVSQLEDAVDLYRGGLLEDISVDDSAAFREWVLLKREQFRRRASIALCQLAKCYEDQGMFERALEHAWRLVELEPWDEQIHRQVMRLLAFSGQRGAALTQYKVCRRLLEDELGVDPEEATVDLYTRIRDGPPLSALTRAPPHNLPASLTPFVGREAELAQIGRRLLDPACRLLTLVGPGGIGKTRLALEAAADLMAGSPDRFSDGVYLVPLASLDSPEAIVSGVAQAVGCHSAPGGTREQRLLEFLRDRCVLLILDGFEHLLAPSSYPARSDQPSPRSASHHGARSLVVRILRAASNMKMLVTSRVALNLKCEHRFPVPGMSSPPPRAGAAISPDLPGYRAGSASRQGEEENLDLTQYSAVKLFLQGAGRIQPGFEPTLGDLDHIALICRLVAGTPLAILLAAAWVRTLAPAQILTQVKASFDFLQADWADLPKRSRSMRAVFDHSWSLLTEREQNVFQKLSVFRDGFTARAAECVTGACLAELEALAARSLLHCNDSGRYQLHELVRQYAADRLRAGRVGGSPGGVERVQEQHVAYYAAALESWATQLKGPGQREALVEMNADGQNIRSAWEFALEEGQIERLDQMMEGLQSFYWRSGRYHEGEAAFRHAAARLTQLSPVPADVHARVLARVLAWQSSYCQALGRIELAARLQDEARGSLQMLESHGQEARCEKALLYWLMGRRVHVSNHDQARRWYETSLGLYRLCQDRWGTANLLHALGSIARFTGSMSEARQLCEESLAIRRVLGDRTGVAKSTVYLAEIALHQGRYEESERLAREGIAECRQLADQAEWAYGLHILGTTLEMNGKFTQALPIHEQSLAIFRDLGRRHYLAAAQSHLASTKMHLGRYGEAHNHASACLTLARQTDLPFKVAQAQRLLGALALTEGAYAECRRHALESLKVSKQTGHATDVGLAHVVLAHAARGSGDLDSARRHVSAALLCVAKAEASTDALWVLSAAVLVLADQGAEERAVELYRLLWRFRHVANSRWFADVVGKPVAAILMPGVVGAAQAPGRPRDLRPVIGELVAEFGLSAELA